MEKKESNKEDKEITKSKKRVYCYNRNVVPQFQNIYLIDNCALFSIEIVVISFNLYRFNVPGLNIYD